MHRFACDVEASVLGLARLPYPRALALVKGEWRTMRLIARLERILVDYNSLTLFPVAHCRLAAC